MKRLLLDTHVLLWWLADDKRIKQDVRECIIDGQNDVYVSAATVWEISIKKTLGKLNAPDDIDTIVEQEKFIKLPVTLFHAQCIQQLPPHHRDPFDRMLITQAHTEGLTLVTADKHFAPYSVQLLWA